MYNRFELENRILNGKRKIENKKNYIIELENKMNLLKTNQDNNILHNINEKIIDKKKIKKEIIGLLNKYESYKNELNKLNDVVKKCDKLKENSLEETHAIIEDIKKDIINIYNIKQEDIKLYKDKLDERTNELNQLEDSLNIYFNNNISLKYKDLSIDEKFNIYKQENNSNKNSQEYNQLKTTYIKELDELKKWEDGLMKIEKKLEENTNS